VLFTQIKLSLTLCRHKETIAMLWNFCYFSSTVIGEFNSFSQSDNCWLRYVQICSLR